MGSDTNEHRILDNDQFLASHTVTGCWEQETCMNGGWSPGHMAPALPV